jgi:tRNA pseudouridine13 synthase
MKIRGMQQPFFSKGERLGKVPVGNLTWEAGDDELKKGRRKLTMRFELPRGAYATMLVKRLMVAG